jgi:tight adherence protein B
MGFLFVAFLIFSGALLAAAYYAFSVPRQEAAQALTGRLRDLRARSGVRTRSANDLIRRETRGTFGFLADFVAWVGVLRRLQEYIEQANLRYRAHDVLAVTVIVFVVSYLLLGLFGMPVFLLRLIAAILIGAVPLFLILRARAKRLRKFEENLPDAIDLFNRSMKAGHNIHAGLETIAAETFDPVRMEFRKVIEELALGSQLEAALHELGRRIPLVDLKFFVISLILQRQTGANMVQVLDNLSLLVRERLNLAAKMKAATAQQRFSAGLLCALPVVVGLGFWIVKPEYIRLLYSDATGSKFLTYAIVSEAVGILIIRRIASPKF